VLLVAMAAVLLLPPGGGPVPEYLAYPGDDPNWNDTAIAAAAVDSDGAVVVFSGKDVFPSAGPHGPSRAPNLFHPPLGVIGGETRPERLSIDGDGRVWALLGRDQVPVRVSGEVTHPAAGALVALARDRSPALPGALPGASRVIDAVNVRDDASLLVATHPGSLPADADTLNVLIHRLAADGSAELIAGRPAGSVAPRRGLAADLEPGTSVPATEIELDNLVTLLPLTTGAHLVVIRPPVLFLGRHAGKRPVPPLSFLVLEGGRIRRLPLENTFPDQDRPGLSASALTDGRVVVNVVAVGRDAARRPVALLIDPATGSDLVVSPDRSCDARCDLVIADGTDLLTFTPRGSDPDDRTNTSTARMVRRPAPPRRTS
jgi:hypothetical protein